VSTATLSIDGARMCLRGDLTASSAPSLLDTGRAELASRSGGRVELDLSGVARSDSSGLALVVDWIRTARAQGLELVVSAVPAQLASIAAVSGLSDLLGGGVQRASG
jgi:phospholipid transport system transporter-binding protein